MYSLALCISTSVKAQMSGHWQIVYGEGQNKEVRDDALHNNQNNPLRFILNELNGIRSHISHLNNDLHGWFGLANSELLVSDQLEGNDLLFQTYTPKNHEALKSGGKINSTRKILSPPSIVIQQAELKKDK